MRHALLACCLSLATLITTANDPIPNAETNTPEPAAAATDAAAPAPERIVLSMGTSAEWSGEFPRFLPLAAQAGVRSYRIFPEWHQIQPTRDEWRWDLADRQVAAARENGMRIYGGLAYLARWASHTGDTRTFPLKNPDDWGTFAEAAIGRYRDDITYWEVYNEFNGGFAKNGKPADYAQIIRQTHAAAQRANPDARIGIGCADVDISFLERVIEAGAADHFHFVTVHPYSLLGATMNGREEVMLRLGDNLRAMLAKHEQSPDIELIVSEIGIPAREGDAAAEQRQAEGLVKAHALLLGQGFTRVYWFEGRGPAYGHGSFGVIRRDWTLRPSYHALQTMARLFGDDARRIAWYAPNDTASYGFAFDGADGPVLIMWANGDSDTVSFPGPVTTTAIDGSTARVDADTPVTLTNAPVFITGLPDATVAAIRANTDQPFPWLLDYSQADAVTVTMGAANVEDGLIQAEQGDGQTATGLIDGVYARRTLRGQKKYYMYFDVDDSYASVGDKQLQITVTARPVDPEKGASFFLLYESEAGYKPSKERPTLANTGEWQTLTFTVDNANFANNWGWNFRIDVLHSPGDIWVKDVSVKRLQPKQ